MKKCPNCGQEFEGEKCPSCEKKSSQPRSRSDSIKRFMGRFLFVAVLFALFVAVIWGTDWIIAWFQSLFA